MSADLGGVVEEEKFLADYPDLKPFVLPLSDSKPSFDSPSSNILGHGTKCRVEKVAIPGAVCAAKRVKDIHVEAARDPNDFIKKVSAQFVRECQLMSTLRHPNIVQFLGIAFFRGSPLPALVMELLLMTLHGLLVPDPPLPAGDPKRCFPLSLKCDILHNIACGLAYLHERHKPIIHRNLSAKKVLLNSEMVAKIGDLSTARTIAGAKLAAWMTKDPGDLPYMPPEATADHSKYHASIDIFSLGVLAIFVTSEKYPNPPLSAAFYEADTGELRARTELQRRNKYMHYVKEQLHACGQLRGDHPLIQLIQQCLHNDPDKRPSICEVLHLLEEAKAGVRDESTSLNKLELIQCLVSNHID